VGAAFVAPLLVALGRGLEPLGAVLPLAAVALALPLVRTVRSRSDGQSLNAALAGTGRLLAAYSLLLSAGILLG
jgi:1,4-dihydroxy-2-naphthoate octaprenyltransferase